jgi:hypothetical protein
LDKKIKFKRKDKQEAHMIFKKLFGVAMRMESEYVIDHIDQAISKMLNGLEFKTANNPPGTPGHFAALSPLWAGLLKLGRKRKSNRRLGL